jgi:hypothetical protein
VITTNARRHQGRYFVVWITAAFAAWVALVPAATAVSTFIWLSAATAVVIVVAATRSAWPTQPVADVLYRVENAEPRR